MEHAERFVGGAAERLGDEDRFAGGGGGEHRFLVQVVWQGDDDDVGLGVADGLFEIGGVPRDAPLGGEFRGAIGRTRIDDVDPIAAAMAVEGHRVEHTDQAGAEHG